MRPTRTSVPDADDVVERIPLHGRLARVVDHAKELRPRESRRALRLGHVGDPLVLEGAVDVVGAEVERDRRGLLAEHDPVGLDVGEVVEQEPRGGDRAEGVCGRRLPRHELRVADLIDEGDEGQKPPRSILLGPEPEKVVHPLRQGFDVAEQHGRVGGDAERVGEPVDLAPAVRVGLAGIGEGLGDPPGEDLRAAAGQGVEPRRLQALERLLRLDLPAPPEVVDLGRGERLDLHRGARGVDGLDQPLIVLERPIRVVPAHDVHLGHSVLDHSEHILDRVLEGAGPTWLAREVAEAARQHADVGGVDVAVDHEVDAVAVQPCLDVIGEPPEPEQVAGLEQGEPVVPRKALPRADLRADPVESGVGETHGASLAECSGRTLRMVRSGRVACQEPASDQNFGYRSQACRPKVTVTNSSGEVAVTRSSLREYAAVQRLRYQQAPSRAEKHRLLDEVVAVTGIHRKAAIRMLRRAPRPRPRPGPGGRPREYGPEVAAAATVLWEAAGRIGAHRLHPFVPELLARLVQCDELTVLPAVEKQLRRASAATLKRLLAPARAQYPPRGATLTHPGPVLKHEIPIRTFAEWDDVRPGFLEIDLVGHCGSSTEGFFLYTLCAVDIATAWIELEATWGKYQDRVGGAVDHIRRRLPMPLRGLDSDNGSEFINRGLLDYCRRHAITFTRSRAWKKNDSAHV